MALFPKPLGIFIDIVTLGSNAIGRKIGTGSIGYGDDDDDEEEDD